MKHHQILSRFSLPAALFAVVLSLGAGSAMAQIYRCEGGSGGAPEYINNPKDAQQRGCKIMQGGNVTVVSSGVPAAKVPVKVAAASPSAGAPRTDGGGGAEQKARDSDSRAILESELKKAETRLAEQQKEYNNGTPEKQGIESRNFQRYTDRVNEMKDAISRNESDIAGLKREISRLPSSN
jgi:hypothetical protein